MNKIIVFSLLLMNLFVVSANSNNIVTSMDIIIDYSYLNQEKNDIDSLSYNFLLLNNSDTDSNYSKNTTHILPYNIYKLNGNSYLSSNLSYQNYNGSGNLTINDQNDGTYKFYIDLNDLNYANLYGRQIINISKTNDYIDLLGYNFKINNLNNNTIILDIEGVQDTYSINDSFQLVNEGLNYNLTLINISESTNSIFLFNSIYSGNSQINPIPFNLNIIQPPLNNYILLNKTDLVRTKRTNETINYNFTFLNQNFSINSSLNLSITNDGENFDYSLINNTFSINDSNLSIYYFYPNITNTTHYSDKYILNLSLSEEFYYLDHRISVVNVYQNNTIILEICQPDSDDTTCNGFQDSYNINETINITESNYQIVIKPLFASNSSNINSRYVIFQIEGDIIYSLINLPVNDLYFNISTQGFNLTSYNSSNVYEYYGNFNKSLNNNLTFYSLYNNQSYNLSNRLEIEGNLNDGSDYNWEISNQNSSISFWLNPSDNYTEYSIHYSYINNQLFSIYQNTVREPFVYLENRHDSFGSLNNFIRGNINILLEEYSIISNSSSSGSSGSGSSGSGSSGSGSNIQSSFSGGGGGSSFTAKKSNNYLNELNLQSNPNILLKDDFKTENKFSITITIKENIVYFINEIYSLIKNILFYKIKL